ncbi:stage II sporulation protein R [Clostridiaceae bacterium UIB06]|uniref:Stage II sporulation protein R n=1 Tax=Clostridium thailandense TaxID=2794346 RepID=A0A949TS66_9CLOT|nr:stage II sporulation protein R [Clostridium thailandense]MBV7272366.1 stage II sporulation protein R [Clostridium thailandense]MCH5135921.1 stage II sporulation protein R [Clostridiaceae bacterium UIB06]
MKKITIIVLCILAIFALGTNKIQGKSESLQEDIASKIIRFHVIANSDSKSDQALKLKIRDKVIEYIQPKLKNSKNIEESRKIIRENDKEIIDIANKVINDNGFNYSVKTTLSNENFPIKTYGNITLPPGRYEAYRIIIGDGKGQNWWCVMFPPLCFVDITKGEVSYKETETEMKSVLSPEEYKMVNNQLDKSRNSDIKVKFKILEMLEMLGNKKSQVK